MARFTLKSALTGIALAGTLVASALPHAAHAAAYHPLAIVDQYKGVVDKALGFGTHWECVTDVSNPAIRSPARGRQTLGRRSMPSACRAPWGCILSVPWVRVP